MEDLRQVGLAPPELEYQLHPVTQESRIAVAHLGAGGEQLALDLEGEGEVALLVGVAAMAPEGNILADFVQVELLLLKQLIKGRDLKSAKS